MAVDWAFASDWGVQIHLLEAVPSFQTSLQDTASAGGLGVNRENSACFWREGLHGAAPTGPRRSVSLFVTLIYFWNSSHLAWKNLRDTYIFIHIYFLSADKNPGVVWEVNNESCNLAESWPLYLWVQGLTDFHTSLSSILTSEEY